MKPQILSLLMVAVLITGCTSADKNTFKQQIVSQDISNFWKAYDAIHSTKDSLKQMSFLKDLFLDPASDGQKRMISARRYTAEEYLEAIKAYPKFWNSLRPNTENVGPYNKELLEGVEKLRAIYPDLEQATFYYTMGVFRSPGTGVDSFALIGSEYALGDLNTVTLELNEHQQNYFKMNPTQHLEILSIHEYIHTQQKPMAPNLLSETLYEGIAEFVAQVATQKETPHKAFIYGSENKEKVKAAFERDMFRPSSRRNWLWNSSENEFGTNDMGYYIGHKIASIHYENSIDKNRAIKTLIELDYSNESEVEKLVDGTKFFSKPINQLNQTFEALRPTVLKIEQFKNQADDVDSNIKEITIVFSQALNGHNTGVDYGPLGKEYFPKMGVDRTWSKDLKSWTMPVDLEPEKHYQFLISNNFRQEDGTPLKSYLIEFKTK